MTGNNPAPDTPAPERKPPFPENAAARVPQAPRSRYAPPARRVSGRPGRRWLGVLRVIALVIALPAVALGMGLLLAWIVHVSRGNGSSTTPVALPTPSASAPNASAKPSASASPVVPADWVTEVSPPAGLTFRHPPGWIRRTATPEIVRFAPASPGSTAPGVEGVGAGFEAAGTPAQAVQDFAARAYGSQPGYAVTAPIAAAAHPGEQQTMVTYQRGTVAVRVVVRSFRTAGRTVLVFARAARADDPQATRLAGIVEASLRVST